jgi:hypothetical protein
MGVASVAAVGAAPQAAMLKARIIIVNSFRCFILSFLFEGCFLVDLRAK